MAPQKTVLITGCNEGGIGNALAREFQLRGLRVFATARTAEKINDLEALGIECLSLVVDDPKSVAACHDQVEKSLDGQGLDFLVNNAGKVLCQPGSEIDIDEAQSLFAVNVLAIMNINKTFLPDLLRAKGTIVHIGSVGGAIPFPFHSVYSASKAALKAYCDTIRVELAPFDVKVTYVQTGTVKSNIYRGGSYLRVDGLYGEIADYVDKRLRDGSKEGWEAQKFAENLVTRVTKGHKDTIWLGEESFLIWFIKSLQNWLPFDLWSPMQFRGWGLAKVALAVKIAAN